MKRLLSVSVVAFLAFAFVVDDAEARRLGGARSFGMQRQSVAPSKSVQQTPPSQTAAAAPAAAAGTAGATKPAGNRWMGPIAGLAAGLGLGWLFSQGGFGAVLGTLLMLALIAFAVMLVLRLLVRPRAEGNMQYAGTGAAAAPPPALAPGSGGAPTLGVQPRIPAGFDTDGFLRQAKLNFVKLQAAHDSGKLDELREFISDEMFESIRQDIEQRGASGQQTDVLTLDAELLEALTEGDTHWASVRFSGMIREQSDARPEAFGEIWNLAKPVSGASGWLLAGIQQVQ
jgi:predicted lipid-binding transport protein (Tim44 family)